ncbi:MAG: CDP-diacylglycerol--glycerol-3-phosphate 3-phosphatidyltransferase [Legionellaceae bacterium]
MLTIPNALTLFRIILIPIMVLVYYLPVSWGHWAAAAIFTFASITDWLDGYLARTLRQTTALGAFLDPVADKLIVAIALVILVGSTDLAYLAIPAAIIVGREIVISALREWMAELGKRASVAVSFIGKVKTTLQMVAVILLFAYQPGKFVEFGLIGYLLLILAAILTLWSMILYLKTAWPEIKPIKS